MAKNKDKKKPTKPTKPTRSDVDRSTLSLTASSQAIDPSLASLFGSSLGPVKAPQRTYTPFAAKKAIVEDEEEEEKGGDDDEDTATLDGESIEEDGAFSGDDNETREELRHKSKGSITKPMVTAQPEPERRAKRKRTEDDLEERYMQRLQEEEDVENKKLEAARKAKQETKAKKLEAARKEDEEESPTEEGEDEDSEDESDGGRNSGSEGGQEKKRDKKGITGTGGSTELFPIRHETLEPQKHEDLDEAARTVFLGNVPSIAISSKSSYKTLRSVFSAPGKIFKLRFRSIAFSEQIPRKAAFATHKLHEKLQTVNAYVVYQTKEAAREALKLNGSVVLDRHIRVDSVAHPAIHDTQRSVFIGNLDFEAQEESLWRHFAPCGMIEYVRIVRDGATNVGKGFAYVQFEDVISVEQALLLDGQKMQNDRKLRVSRAKAVKRKNKSADVTRGPPSKKQKVFVPRDDPRQKEMLGRARKLLGKAGAAKAKKAPESFIFEGTRATATATANSGIKLGGKKKGKPARARANARSSAWRHNAKK